ncbi:MAG TPA: hypothetical protein P5137_17220, partial [Candidatus Brocadiia bacterium]|nr:hypothetical protein [Candidatus Brocadiia bacterium]
ALAMAWTAWGQEAPEWIRNEGSKLAERAQREKQMWTREMEATAKLAAGASEDLKPAYSDLAAKLKALIDASDALAAAVKAEKWGEAVKSMETMRALRSKVEGGRKCLDFQRRMNRLKESKEKVKDDAAAQAKIDALIALVQRRLEIQKQVNDLDEKIGAAEAEMEIAHRAARAAQEAKFKEAKAKQDKAGAEAREKAEAKARAERKSKEKGGDKGKGAAEEKKGDIETIQ